VTSAIEINNMGKLLKVDITDDTTSSELCDIINNVWSGCAHLASEIDLMGNAFHDAARSVELVSDAQKRKQKHIDRIARDAEAAQRRAKGGKWK
jgi:hypothetical protein